jgi:hypothetical protein
MESKRALEDTLRAVRYGKYPELSGRVGYVYPTGEESYYLSSSIEGGCIRVDCPDGFFYAEEAEDRDPCQGCDGRAYGTCAWANPLTGPCQMRQEEETESLRCVRCGKAANMTTAREERVCQACWIPTDGFEL